MMDSGETVRRVNKEAVLLLGWGRAILLQLAHPLVAAGVAEHSDYGAGLAQYLSRVRQTVGSMLSLTFGETGKILATAGRINAIHRRVHGQLSESTQQFPRGTPYSATDPELLRWVHVTLIETQLLTYERFVGALTGEQKDRYCAEAAQVAPLLGIPDRFLPTGLSELTGHLQEQYSCGTIEVTQTARQLAETLLSPPGSILTRHSLVLGRFVTVGMLPPTIRQAYGFSWDAGRERRFRQLAKLLRGAHRLTPPPLREWPSARTVAGRSTPIFCPNDPNLKGRARLRSKK